MNGRHRTASATGEPIAMSQQQPPGWHPGAAPPGAPPGYYPPQQTSGQYGPPGHGPPPGYPGHSYQPQPQAGGGSRGVVTAVVVALVGLLVLGGIGAGVLVWYQGEETAREDQHQRAAAAREAQRQ